MAAFEAHPAACPRSFWFNRFQVDPAAEGYRFRDRLLPACRRLPEAAFAGLAGNDLDVAFFRLGFMSPCLPHFPKAVGDAPSGAEDRWFWQFPCRTEAAAHAVHAALAEVPLQDGALHCYVGLPWATFIDKGQADETGLRVARVRLSGLRHALEELGVALRVHTVCQHVYWSRLVAVWHELGVTDLWLSHAPASGSSLAGLPFTAHPWALFAVNVEDPQRREGLVFGKDPAQKQHLASFVGAHAEHYLSDVRLRLRVLAETPGFVVRVTDKWHFEEVVYRHQAGNASLADTYRIDATVSDYNHLLSESVFALCPSGAGPNTLRLWEALAVGAVPVLLGPAPRLPQGGSLAPIDWERIVLRVDDSQIAGLPSMLRNMGMDEIRRRQCLGMEAYAKVRAQCCF